MSEGLAGVSPQPVRIVTTRERQDLAPLPSKFGSQSHGAIGPVKRRSPPHDEVGGSFQGYLQATRLVVRAQPDAPSMWDPTRILIAVIAWNTLCSLQMRRLKQ